MISFYTERTAEYALVPAFSNILNTLGKVAPIFFWKTREGNRTSEAIHDDKVRVIAFFARRPKIDTRNINFIGMRINDSLYEFSERAKSLNIPVFCGLPITTNIFELDNPDCLWFHIDSKYRHKPTYEYVGIDIENEKYIDGSISSLTQEEIIDIVNAESVKMSWKEAVEIIGKLNENYSTLGYMSRFIRNTHYKPVYFLIKTFLSIYDI